MRLGGCGGVGTALACGLLLLLSDPAHALTQARTPSACANDPGIGSVNWTSTGNALASDAVPATASVTGNATTRFLECTGYGFTIPFGSIINGIIVDVERRTSSTGAGGSRDAAVRIVKGGIIGAADRATANNYTTSFVTEPHGSATDLWGLAWTSTDINAANFGAAVAARKNNPAQTHTLSVDVVSITVDYTPPPIVVSINRAGASPTAAATVDWTVTFSEAVSGVDNADFFLAATGLAGASIISVTGGPTIYTVTANSGVGVGTLGLNLVDDDTIVNAVPLPLSGTAAADGSFTGQTYNINRPSVASFNVVEANADPVSGRIFTKVAAQGLVVDVVALNAGNTLAAGFADTVAVELVDNTSGGACAGLPLIKALANETFLLADNGRHRLTTGQSEAEAYRNVRFRIKYPVAAPTVVACSSDAFANRPLAFASVQARDQDRLAAGTARVLGNTADPGTGTVHNAGRPFRIDATAQNGAGAPAATALYVPDAGQPVAVVAQCASGTAACVAAPAALTLGAWSVAAGAITTVTASYPDVGAFALDLEDQTFAAVDAADGTSAAVRHIRSAAALTVGRFVPDHFAVTGNATTPRSDLPACAGSAFTYMDERMDLVFTLHARAFGGTPTAAYAGTLAALPLNNAASYNFGAVDSVAPTPLNGARLDLSLIPGIATPWVAGAAAVTAPIAISRAAAPDGPYTSVRIGIAPSDADGVTLAAFDLDADNSGSNERAQVGATTAVRFGRLRMDNAVGSERRDLPIPIQLQYWAGTAFETNTADTCTTLNTANVALSDYIGGVNGANVTAANLTPATIVFSGPSPGVGSLVLTPPAPAATAPGALTLTVDLTAEAKSYLKGNWGVATYTADPRARAAFGLYGSQPRNFIYFRENF